MQRIRAGLEPVFQKIAFHVSIRDRPEVGGARSLHFVPLLALVVLSASIIKAQSSSMAAAFQIPSSTAPEASTPAASASTAIPLAQVAERAEELDRLLEEISRQLAVTPDLRESYRAVQTQAEEISARIPLTEGLLADLPTVLDLRDEDQYWRSLSQEYTAQRRQLTTRAEDLEGQIRVLDKQQLRWQATRDQIQDSTGIQSVFDRIVHELDAIQTTRTHLQEQLNLVLTLQNLVSQQDRQISDVLTQLVNAQERLRGRLLQRDSAPLWAIGELRKFEHPMTSVMRGAIDRDYTNAKDFLRAHQFRMLVILALYILGVILTLKLKHYLDTQHVNIPVDAAKIFARPFSLALLAALLGTVGAAASSPTSIALFLYLLCVIMTLRLLPPLIEPELGRTLYALAIFNVFEGILIAIPFSPVLKRLLFTLGVLGALVVFGWLTLDVHSRQLQAPRIRWLTLKSGMKAALIMLAATLAASVGGYSALAQVLGESTILGGLLIGTFYTGFRVLALILTLVLHSKWSREVFEERVNNIERWGLRLLSVSAVLFWLRSELYLLTINDVVLGAVSRVLKYPIGLDRIHFTLSDVLSVVLILVLGYAFANAVSFILEKLLLSKLHLQRGLPLAISTVTYYFLLLLVALAALTDAGVELNKFTVITGAVGVGLGFGLQNIVNNFISGLILLFERPIRIGDTVDLDGLVGTVRRIGARSSTVVTFQGAEVIVPNSNLISNQVVNWTLTSPWRRVEIPVRVAYGTDPEQVLSLLTEVAESHPGIMTKPREPKAFFLGFGDSALNFELRFWSAQQETWFQLKSDVTVAIARALQQAGIEVPYPQQDLHVRSIDDSVQAGLAVTRTADKGSV